MATDETFEPYAIVDQFCETLVRIDTLGPCRRLVFAVRDNSGGEQVRNISAKLVMSAEAMIEIGRMMQAGAPACEPLATFLPTNHRAN
jgi:hypothetical protein